MIPDNLDSTSTFKANTNDSFIALCSDDGPKGMLTWISWYEYETKIQPLIKKAGNQLITKNTTTVCIFVHIHTEHHFELKLLNWLEQ